MPGGSVNDIARALHLVGRPDGLMDGVMVLVVRGRRRGLPGAFSAQQARRHRAPQGQQHGEQDQDEDAKRLHGVGVSQKVAIGSDE